MATLKKYDLSGKEVGEVSLDDADLTSLKNLQGIKEYLVAIRANARQWSANTKERSEVAHSRKKPHPQKGTGRARQGCIAAAQYRGGGIVFGPKPKFDQRVRINRKEKRAAISHLLSEKVGEQQIKVLDAAGLSAPKTKTLSSFLKTLGLDGKRVLFLCDEGEGKDVSAHLVKSLRNIPRVSFVSASQMSGYDISLNQEIIVVDGAFDSFANVLRRK